MTSLAEPPIRRLGIAEVDACVNLIAERGYPREPRKWALMMDLGEVYGIGEEKLVGTVALVRYGPELAMISMMAVAAEHDGRGHGRRLMQHLLRTARRGQVALYSTDRARPMYLSLGFRTVGRSVSYFGQLPAALSGRTRLATPADLAAIALADRTAYGADRSAMLRGWLTGDNNWMRVSERDGRITGHGGAWRTTDEQTLIGPVVADDLVTATALISDLAADAAGPIRVDVDPRTPGLESWAIAEGLVAPRRSFPLMVMDGEPLAGERQRLYAPTGSALG